jgi:hypothetical protein
MSIDALRDIERFAELGPDARGELASTIAQLLGPPWSAGAAELIDAVPLFNSELRLDFVAIPGGTFEMGLTAADVEAVKFAIGWDEHIAGTIDDARDHVTPSRRVDVSPFLIARDTLFHADVERLSHGKHTGIYCHQLARLEARLLAGAVGLRLPSEAEFEWVMREGGRCHFAFDASRKLDELGNDTEVWPTRFGIRRPFGTSWCADDYHDGYGGAPPGSKPWMEGEPDGLARPSGAEPELVDEVEQWLGLLACWRTARGHGSARVRLARDLELP